MSLTLVLLVFAGWVLVDTYNGVLGREYRAADITHYLDATRRWLESGTPYLASEVAGRFEFQPLTFLHPPLALYLFLPFTVLPLVLWWAIPIATTCWLIWSWRPDRWAGPLIALCLAWPRTSGMLVVGNTDLWVSAFLALGLRFGWPALLIAIKPSFAPFVFAGARSRSWWIGLPLVALSALPFGGLWFDWLAVVRNAPADMTYSALNMPLLLIPVIAWLRRTRRPTPAAERSRPDHGRSGPATSRTAMLRPFRSEAP